MTGIDPPQVLAPTSGPGRIYQRAERTTDGELMFKKQNTDSLLQIPTRCYRYRLVATATRLVATTPTGCHRNLPTPCYTVVARARSSTLAEEFDDEFEPEEIDDEWEERNFADEAARS